MGYAFISYSTKNQLAADSIRNLFKEENIDVWMAPYDIPAGSKYAAIITGAIRDCSCFVLLLSEDSQASEAVDSEVELATLTYKKSIITVQLENVVLNDSFTFYIHNKQIIAVNSIDKESPDFKQVIYAVKVYTQNDISSKSHFDSTPAPEISEKKETVKRPYFNQNVIKTVLSIGAKYDLTAFPKGSYSSKISLRKCSYVYFHTSLKAPVNENRNVFCEIHIFDDMGNLVSDISDEIECQSGHDKLSKGLIIKDDDGNSMPVGRYYAEIRIDDSLPFRYNFMLVK